VPAVEVAKLATSPGFDTPEGTVHAYEYAPDCDGTAVIVDVFPVQIVALFTVTIGRELTVTVPVPEAGVHPPSE
jgi:hypothetical protein